MAKDPFDKQHAQRIRENHIKCATTVQIADILFDLARESKSSDIEDLAIMVSALAGDGHELSADGLQQIVARVTSIQEAL